MLNELAWNIGKTATAIDTSKNIAAGTYGFDVIDEKGWPNGTAPRRSRLEGRYCVRGVDHSDRTWYGRDGGYFDLAVSWLYEVARRPSTAPLLPHGHVEMMTGNDVGNRSPSRPSTWMCGR